MARAIRIHQYGGPEVLSFEEVATGSSKPEQLRIRQTAIGVNFIDTYHRTGLYPLNVPSGLGVEAAGVVVETGSKVTAFARGDRVAYVDSTPGSYAEERVIDTSRVVKLPDGISDQQAAALMLKGLTAWFLLRRCYRVKKNEQIVLHSATGGVGLIALQWATALGAKVIAVVGSDAKAAIAREYGAAEVIVSAREDLLTRVREITKKRGVPVVYDGVGKDTFFASLDCLKPRGLMVSFGNASGPVPPFSPLELARRGSLFVTRPVLFHYIAKASDRARGARELFEIVASGKVKVKIGQTYSLSSAAQAHRDLEARRTTGSVLLIP